MKKLLIIDFGSQYTQLLARRVREIGAYSEVVQHDEKLDLSEVQGIILSGGPKSIYDTDAPKVNPNIYTCGLPILGVCYGMQAIANDMGGEVKHGDISEYGKTNIQVQERQIIFNNIPDSFNSWMSHGDTVTKAPEGAVVTAKSSNGLIAAFEIKEKKIYAIQFHPEVRHTEHGTEILENFVLNVCKLSNTWSLSEFLEKQIETIKNVIGDKKAIVALSGGVDSSVAAVLTYKAIGSNLKAVFVDHGLLRLNEETEVKRIFRDAIGLDLTVVDAKKRFLDKLAGVTDPEKKRKIIGEEFIRVFEDEAKKDPEIKYLIQGTIYSDVIESAASGKKTAKIKSHHNVGGLPEHMDLKIFEPLRNLFKDEVRSMGELMAIPKHVLYRHPFPGPGLAIRIIGEITQQRLDILKKADSIFIDVLRETGWYNKVWQAFAVLTDMKSVGVVGDERSYDYVLALRSVDSVEGMTADWSRIPFEVLELASRRIVNSVDGVGRVVFDITSKPPATIEWE